MALANGSLSLMNSQPCSSKPATSTPSSISNSLLGNSIGRRGVLTLLVSTATAPEVNDSKKALLQEYLKKSKENKAKNDKERLEDYYRRNYTDYFEFIEGSVREKREDLLSESEKGILEWLQKNRK
ncbi:hypothetical protein Cni_G06549 [Canna indica]|uniref:Uncharacterized protein n=1 Tax=Canna indica TaxID=4628 RepID=A0AAQ3K0G4_9LILI|nr:hypothetical protein Cni_G06549 [Canna indica]